MADDAELETRNYDRRTCHKCGHPDVMRIPRRWHDHVFERLGRQTLRRYRCGRCLKELVFRA